MNKIKIQKTHDGIMCSKIMDGQLSYVNDKNEFYLILRSVEKSSQIKIKDKDMAINIKGGSIVLKDYETLLEMPEFSSLIPRIKECIEINGFIDLTDRDKTARKGKNNKYKNGIIAKVALIVLIGTLTINLFITNLSKVNAQENLPNIVITHEDIEYEEPVIFAEPHITENQIQNQTEFTSVSLDYSTDIAQLNFEELSNTKKAQSAEQNYFHIIEQCSKDMGLDASLMLGIATQERGVHSSEIDAGGGIGLMQVQYSVWANETINYYKLNPETNTFEMHSEKITDEKLENLESNIEIGCMIFQNCLINSKYNIPMAIQMYNMGYGAVYDIIDAYAQEKGITRAEVVNNPTDLGWLKYRYLKNGDPNYLENVNKWIDKNTFMMINVLDGSVVTFTFDNANEKTASL